MPSPWDRVRNLFTRRPVTTIDADVVEVDRFDLPLRRAATATALATRREGLTLSPIGGAIDADDYAFRRVSTGEKFKKRDLMPMAHDRMIEIAWYTWEQNPFGRRIITAMTDIVVGEGVSFSAKDPAVLEAGNKVWNHPVNRLGQRARELHNALSVNGELILPVGINDVTGVPTIGYIDPIQVDAIEPRADNVLVPEFVRLKKVTGEAEARRLKIIAPDPVTNLLDGEVFYHGINKLPNSMRGRSDYLPLADWLDLFDQYMFAEVERVRLLSAFVWDLECKNLNNAEVAARAKELGTPQSGSMFAHNEHEILTPQSANLNASDRSETAKLLTIHIAGSLGMPISWFGWQDSNRATIEGQNDVAMKTPAARQKEFGSFLNLIVRFGIERQMAKNAILFRSVTNNAFEVSMPEIAAKDLARAGTALASVVSAHDTAMSNGTMSRRVATTIQLALSKHLVSGQEFNAEDVMKEADEDKAERQADADLQMASAAALVSARGMGKDGRGVGPGGRQNAPVAAA